MKIKPIVTFFLCSVILISNISLATLNVEAKSMEGMNFESMILKENFSLRSDQIVIIYSKDGHYKRYYNRTTGKWVGDWIKIS